MYCNPTFLYDIYGKKYLDFGSGIGVCALGYHDMAYTNSLKKQIDKLLHTSNLFYNVPAIQAAKQFNEAANMERYFLQTLEQKPLKVQLKLQKNIIMISIIIILEKLLQCIVHFMEEQWGRYPLQEKMHIVTHLPPLFHT